MRFFKRPAVKLLDDKQEELLKLKKLELDESKNLIVDIIHETKNLTLEIVTKFKQNTSKISHALKSTLNENYDRGIIFISHRGEILFVNKLVVDTFAIPQAKLVGITIDHAILTDSKNKKQSIMISKCSDNLLDKILECGDDVSEQLLVSIGSCFGKKNDDSCTFVLSNDVVVGPFKAKIVLLDPSPKTLSDITYIIYIEPN